MASILKKLFQRKKPAPLVCSVALDPDTNHPIGNNPEHVHTAACFASFEPLALVELFQSQSCKQCQPALPVIHQAAGSDPNVLLLSYNVSIFDHLGWKDSFATANRVGDQRHRAYAKQWGRTNLFTPQVVANGIADGAGREGEGAVAEVVKRARTMGGQMSWHIYIDANDTAIRIDSDRPAPMMAMAPQGQMAGQMGEGQMQMDAGHAGHSHAGHDHMGAGQPGHEVYDVVVIVYQAGDQTIKPEKGPNKGKKMVHRNPVLSVNKIAEWQGGNLTVALPMARNEMQAGTEAVAVVQAGFGGPIVAATKI